MTSRIHRERRISGREDSEGNPREGWVVHQFAFSVMGVAEIAPGVGKHLDMAIIRRGNIHTLTDEEIGALDDIHKERITPHTDMTDERIANLSFEEKEVQP